MADHGLAFELAEEFAPPMRPQRRQEVDQRSKTFERRRPVMQAWASFLT